MRYPSGEEQRWCGRFQIRWVHAYSALVEKITGMIQGHDHHYNSSHGIDRRDSVFGRG